MDPRKKYDLLLNAAMVLGFGGFILLVALIVPAWGFDSILTVGAIFIWALIVCLLLYWRYRVAKEDEGIQADIKKEGKGRAQGEKGHFAPRRVRGRTLVLKGPERGRRPPRGWGEQAVLRQKPKQTGKKRPAPYGAGLWCPFTWAGGERSPRPAWYASVPAARTQNQ